MAIRVAVLSRSGVWDGDGSMICILDTALTKQAKMYWCWMMSKVNQIHTRENHVIQPGLSTLCQLHDLLHFHVVFCFLEDAACNIQFPLVCQRWSIRACMTADATKRLLVAHLVLLRSINWSSVTSGSNSPSLSVRALRLLSWYWRWCMVWSPTDKQLRLFSKQRNAIRTKNI